MSVDRSNYPNIPPDFPIEPTESALAGVQFKLSVVEEAGMFYAPGATPSEVAKAYEACEDFAQQMVPYCERKMTELHLPHEEVLAKLLRGIEQKKWVSPAQARWVVARTQQLLGW